MRTKWKHYFKTQHIKDYQIQNQRMSTRQHLHRSNQQENQCDKIIHSNLKNNQHHDWRNIVR